MPRANRHYLPGQLWHITHRCHKKEILLKFLSISLISLATSFSVSRVYKYSDSFPSGRTL
jgi:hypothetical protein